MEGLAFYVLLPLMGIGLRGRMALVSLHSLYCSLDPFSFGFLAIYF